MRIPAYQLPSTSIDSLVANSADNPNLCSVFVRAYHTATIPGVIVSHCAIAKQLKTKCNGYSTTSSDDVVGFICFPHRDPLPTTSDIFIRLQPTRLRSGLTFTEQLLVPTASEHLAMLPYPPHSYIVRTIGATPLIPSPFSFGLTPSPPVAVSLDHFPEFSSVIPTEYIVRGLTSSALCMLWHQ